VLYFAQSLLPLVTLGVSVGTKADTEVRISNNRRGSFMLNRWVGLMCDVSATWKPCTLIQYCTATQYYKYSTVLLNTMKSQGDSLTCQAVLAPPLKRVGKGEDQLEYTDDHPAWQCSFSPDGQWLAVCYGATSPCIRVWKCINNAWILENTLEGIHERTIRSIAFAPQPSPLVFASASFDGSVAIWEQQGKDWDCIAQLEGHDNEVKCARWNATGTLLATCGRDKSVWIWECFLPGTASQGSEGDFDCLSVLNGHQADVKYVQFADSHGEWGDGEEILLSSSYDDTIRVWAEDTGDWYCAQSIMDTHKSTVWSLAASPSGLRLISASADGSLGILKAYATKEKRERFPKEGSHNNGLWKCVGKLNGAHDATIYSVAYSPAKAGHGCVASCGADCRIQIYREARESSSECPLFTLESAAAVPYGDLNHILWHPLDGSLLASAGDDGLVRIWSYKST